MIGLLPIDRKNFPSLNGDAEQFIAYIMGELTRSWDDVINSLEKDEWILFKDGLVILICTQLLSPADKNTDTNPLELLLTESISKERLDIVRRAIKFFRDVGQDIPEPIWFELLVLDSHTNLIEKITFKRISFEVYLKCAMIILPALPQQQLFVEQASSHFDGCVEGNQFLSKSIVSKIMRAFINVKSCLVDLENITFLLKFLRDKTSENSTDCPNMIRTMIDANARLRNQISQYMSKLDITIQKFDAIRNIFILSSGSSILYHVRKQEFLMKLLTSRNNLRSTEFYTEWFLAFMTPGKDQQSVIDAEEFKPMLKNWTNCFGHLPESTVEMIRRMDTLIAALGDHPHSAYFIEQMVDLCFEQSRFLITIYPKRDFLYIVMFRIDYVRNQREYPTGQKSEISRPIQSGIQSEGCQSFLVRSERLNQSR